MIRIKKTIILLIPYIVYGQFRPDVFTDRIDHILSENERTKYKYVTNGIFDSEKNLWLSWKESDRLYYQWYVQKFDSKGELAFPPIELINEKVTIGRGGAFPIHLGNKDDVYAFPVVGENDFSIVRIDNLGSCYKTNDMFDFSYPDMFICADSMMYLFSVWSNIVKCLKLNIKESLPILLEKHILPGWGKPDGYKYRWIRFPLEFYSSVDRILILLPPNELQPPDYRYRAAWIDSSTISVFRINVPDVTIVDTSSFKVSTALFKKIRGCKFETSALVEGNGDTLLLFLPNRGGTEDLLYVCKLTKNGFPVKSKKIIEEEVKNFSDVPDDLHLEIVFRGSIANNKGKLGIIIYGFDKNGSVYYYLWDKSDDYWR
ncbi:MAG: hypothetical protein WBB37_06530 [bacterium]